MMTYVIWAHVYVAFMVALTDLGSSTSLFVATESPESFST